MPDIRSKVICAFGGGWASDFGPSFTSMPQNGALLIPFLLEADNIYYELDGAPHKVGGSTRLNSTAITEGTQDVHGIFDFWFQGTGGSETQKRVAYAGTRLLKEDVDGTWDELNTGLEDSKEPCFNVFSDDVIWSSTSTTDAPRTWNGAEATMPLLGGSPPQFAFSVVHKNRIWAAGVPTLSSRLYYSNNLLHEDWTTVDGAGSIDVDPEDGDKISGLRSHRNELLVFKGPNKLTIHRITGSSPTGSDAFARIPFVTGVSSVNHNGIITIGDDVVFPSPRGIHSLAATAAFGDYVEAFISRPILSYYQDSLNHSVLNTCWGVNYQTRGSAVYTFAKSGGTAKNVILGYDYRFQPGRWFSLGRINSYVNCHSLATIQVNKVHRLYAGLTDGFVQRIFDVSDRSLPGSGAYTSRVVTPFLNLGTSAQLKHAKAGWVSMAPKGNYSMTVGWTRDRNAEETATPNQGAGDTLG